MVAAALPGADRERQRSQQNRCQEIQRAAEIKKTDVVVNTPVSGVFLFVNQ